MSLRNKGGPAANMARAYRQYAAAQRELKPLFIMGFKSYSGLGGPSRVEQIFPAVRVNEGGLR
jgi:hypothetical protein